MTMPACESTETFSPRNARLNILEGVFFGLMVGGAESYLAAFALAVGLTSVQAGLFATAPMLAGAVLQLASPWAVATLRTYRGCTAACAIMQAIGLLLLPFAAIEQRQTYWLLFSLAACYWAGGLASGPPWLTWMEYLIPAGIRPRFLAHRSRACHLAILLGFAGGGLWLHVGHTLHWEWAAFAILFALAACSRFCSVCLLVRQPEPEALRHVRPTSAFTALAELRQFNGVRLLAYLFGVQMAAQVAGPYFAPYLLTELDLSYANFMVLTAAIFAGKFVALPWWGRVVERWGALCLLRIGGCCIVPLSAVWVIVPDVPSLMVVQFFSGLAWSAYEFGVAQVFLERVPACGRTGVVSLYNLCNSLAIVCGSMLGGIVLSYLASHESTSLGRLPYHTLFLLSSLARFAIVIVLSPRRWQPVSAVSQRLAA